MEVIMLAFMQRALIAAILTGLVAPAIGTYVVQRRLSPEGAPNFGVARITRNAQELIRVTHAGCPLPRTAARGTVG